MESRNPVRSVVDRALTIELDRSEDGEQLRVVFKEEPRAVLAAGAAVRSPIENGRALVDRDFHVGILRQVVGGVWPGDSGPDDANLHRSSYDAAWSDDVRGG